MPWILKTEPSTYSYAQLVADGTTTWDGVNNPVARKHLRAMTTGDDLIIYHTGDDKACVGTAVVLKATEGEVVIRAGKRLAKPVTLQQLRGEKLFADSPLVRMPRLSVIPVSEAQWKRLLTLGA